MKFDFEDDEVLGYYVNLLKTISLRLNEDTVQFFFKSGITGPEETTPRGPPSFPLYTEAVKFVAHRDGMVRAAVKTLTLNVFGIQLPSLRAFLAAPPASRFFDQLAAYTADRCTALDRLLSSWDAAAPRMAATVETYLAEVEDILTFCNDVLAVEVPAISSLLLENLWRQVVCPVLLWPLIADEETAAAAALAAVDISKGLSSNGPAGMTPRTATPAKKGIVGPLCSLYALERAIYAFTDPLFSSLLVSVLLGGPASAAAGKIAESLHPSLSSDPRQHIETVAGTVPLMTASDFLSELQCDPQGYRKRLLSMLGGNDAQLVAASVRLITAILSRRTLLEGTIEAVGLLPRRRRKQILLLEELTRDQSSGSLGVPGSRSETPNGTPKAPQVVAQSTKLSTPKSSALPAATSSGGKSAAGEQGKSIARTADGDNIDPPQLSSSSPPGGGSSGRLRRYSPTKKSEQSLGGAFSSPTAKCTKRGELYFNEFITALLAALKLDLLPPLAMPAIGWALHRLLSSGAGPAELDPEWKKLLKEAMERRCSAIEALVPGPWADTLVPIAAISWNRARGSILRSGAGPVHVAGHTWVQAVLLHELHWQLGGGGATAAVATSNFIVAAKLAAVSVAACVAVAQIRTVLTTGEVPQISPVGVSTPVDSIEAAEIREGSVVQLPKEGCMTCRVSFSRGMERSVLMHVLGWPPPPPPPPLPSQPVPQHEGAAGGGDVNLPKGHLASPRSGNDKELPPSKPKAKALLEEASSPGLKTSEETPSPAPAVSQSQSFLPPPLASPVVAIIDPGTGPTLGYGTVLSVAPLLAAAPAVDSAHPQWLHVHVRPQGSVMLRTLNAGPEGAELASMERQLAEGHWVLAFENGATAQQAADAIVEAAKEFRGAHASALQFLLNR